MSVSTNVAEPATSVPDPALGTFVATANQLIVQAPVGRMPLPWGSVQFRKMEPELWTTVPWTKSAWTRTLESALPVFCSTAVRFAKSGWSVLASAMASVVLLRERLAIVWVTATRVTGTLRWSTTVDTPPALSDIVSTKLAGPGTSVPPPFAFEAPAVNVIWQEPFGTTPGEVGRQFAANPPAGWLTEP